jgi:lia operon protein LiaG
VVPPGDDFIRGDTNVHATRFSLRAAALLTVLATPLATPLASQESFTLTGDRVAVYNLAGQVEVVRGSGPDVRVHVTRAGRDGSELEVAVDPIGGRNVLRVVYPGDDVVYRGSDRGRFNTQVQVRSDGTFGGSGRRVRVRSSGSGLEAHADLRIEVPEGRDLAVHLAVGQADARGVVGNLVIDLGAGRVTAREITGSLSVDTGSGGVEVTDVEGEVAVDTGSGSVSLSRVRGPRVTVDTGSGSVTGEQVASQRLVVDTGSGAIRLAGVAATDIELDTGSGSVTVTLVQVFDRLVVDTGSGRVDVSLPDGVDADVELDTEAGASRSTCRWRSASCVGTGSKDASDRAAA